MADEYFPAAHATQVLAEDAPVELEYLPFPHASQLPAPEDTL